MRAQSSGLNFKALSLSRPIKNQIQNNEQVKQAQAELDRQKREAEKRAKEEEARLKKEAEEKAKQEAEKKAKDLLKNSPFKF